MMEFKMNDELLSILRDPLTGEVLTLKEEVSSEGEVVEGCLIGSEGKQYPIINGIPRFVPKDHYAGSFGHQWNKYSKLQLDSYNGTTFSKDRFFSITEWKAEDLKGKKILDVGCGAGRFTEIALEAGAEVVAVDLSSAVEACKNNLADHKKLNVVQASIYELPFKAGSFDFVYCIGVIQHTPDPKRSILEIAKMARPGGKVGYWIYERDWKAYIGTLGFKYALRPITKNWGISKVESFCNVLESLCWPINRFARKWGIPGKFIMRMLPVSCGHLQGLDLSDEHFREWVRLDTFDMYSPAFDHPQKYEIVSKWLCSQGLSVDSRHPHGGISITAECPAR